MSFIDKDQRITSWKTKTKDNFVEASVTAPFLSSFFQVFFHLDLNCFVQWKTSLALRGHISVAYFFFPCHQDLFIFLFYRIAVSWLSYSGSVWSLGQHVCGFSPAIAHLSNFWCFGNLQNHPGSLKIYASLLISNSKSKLNIKSRRHPT